ncbi:MAG TPA: hypothetical protein VLB85_07810 [Acidimicrobiia bacterium]|nr:hypothetical protein [Acidimicrobiia bacterium]
MRISTGRLIAGVLTAMTLVGLMAAVLPVAAQEGPPQCPPAPAGSIVVELPFEELYTNRGEAASIGSTVNANIPAGQYDIRLTGWDDHVIGDVVKETQLREVYQVQGFSAGSVVFASGETPDLPDEQNTITAAVNTNVAVPALDALRAVHSDPDQDETANSIHPICVVFIPVVQETTTTTVPETTTTVPETTTTVPETTTTTVPETTTTTTPTPTTVPETTTTTVPPQVSSTTLASTTTTVTPATLPFTGSGSDQVAVVALLALVAGTGLVLLSRNSAEQA